MSDSQSIVSNYNHAYHSYYYSHHYINIFNRCNVQKKLQENNVRNFYWGCGSNNPHGFNKSYYYG